MTTTSSKIAALGLLSCALLFTAYAKKGEDTVAPVVETLPEAPDAAIQAVIREFAQGNGGILWEAMPASYQRDVNALVQLAGSKVDAELYDQSSTLLSRLGDVVQKQQAFILNSTLAQRSKADKAQFKQALPAAVGILKTLTSSDLGTRAGLLAFDGQQFFDSTVSKIATYAHGLSKVSDDGVGLADYVAVVVSVVDASDAEATLQIGLPDQVAEGARFSKVEGRWVPAQLAAEWAVEIAGAQAKLEAISVESMAANKPQVMGVLTMIDGVLTQIDAAETQAQFDQAVQGAMMPLMGLLIMGENMGGTMSAPAVPLPGVAPNRLPAVK
jgi:hypothetical protein